MTSSEKTDRQNGDETATGSDRLREESGPPSCCYCTNHAEVSITCFKGLSASESIDACMRCVSRNPELAERVAGSRRIRVVSYATGQHATGPASRLSSLLAMLKPRHGYKSITSAIRITTGRSARSSELVCAACQEPVTPEAPGIVRWGEDEHGKYHSVRVFHSECCTDPGGVAQSRLWERLDDLADLDRTRFTLVAAEMIEQIDAAWKRMT